MRLDLLRRREPDTSDPWVITHVLVPTHQKIRLSFAALRRLAVDLVGWVCTGGGDAHRMVLVDTVTLEKPGETEVRLDGDTIAVVAKSEIKLIVGGTNEQGADISTQA